MNGYEALAAITDNIESSLKGLGVNFSRRCLADSARLPSGVLPAGQIVYDGESFEESLGERPPFSEARFTVRVVQSAPEAGLPYEQHRLVHGMRESLTVDALNSGALAGERRVSRVVIEGADIENGETRSSLTMRLSVRYRC